MSGDVVLADDDDGAVGRLLDTARRLFDAPGFRPAALIGGLAVTCRIRTVHRATVDVGTVTDGGAQVEHALEYLSDGTEARRINIDGVKVDALATYRFPRTPTISRTNLRIGSSCSHTDGRSNRPSR